MTLRIALRDGEKVVINGAVLRSTGRTELRVESRAAVLRGREIMQPEEATTPARQLYFHTMMAYIDPDGLEGHQNAIVASLQQISSVPRAEAAAALAMSYARHAASMRYYQALGDCRGLMRLEEDLLEPAPEQAAP